VVNLNKLFPRLPLRAKFGIAFTLLSLIPLVLVAAITTRVTTARLRAAARGTLEREVRTATAEVEQALTRVEQEVTFITDAFLAELLTSESPPSRSVRRALGEFLDHTPVLFRLKVISPDGATLFEAGPYSRPGEEAGGMYYAWRAQALASPDHLLLPVELRGATSDPDSTQTMPAVAVVVPVRDRGGEYVGVVVGEAYASALFAGLDRVPPALPGTTTGLVDAEHRFLYHSERKRTWASLLGTGTDTGLPGGLPWDSLPRGGLFRTPDHLVSVSSVQLGSSTTPPLSVYRAVPTREVDRPVREFFSWVGVTGGAVVVLVVLLATVAARQLTTPIYRLRDAARRLRSGDQPAPLLIETNDELEDFAADFQSMAASLAIQRRQLEAMVSDRTRELRATHAELAEVLEHSADAIVGLDGQGRVRVWNRGAEALLGYSAGEALGKEADALGLDPERDCSAEQEYLEREVSRRGAVVNFQTRRRTRDGRLIPVSLTQTALRDEEGRQLGTSLILRDTSLQTGLEDQMRRSERLAAMSVMAAGLAHEINNPLAIIGNRLECMEDELRDLGQPALLRDLAVLRQHSARLAQLTGNLLRFARDPDEQPQAVNIGELVRRLGELLAHTLASRNVRIEILTDGDTRVLGVEAALETVYLNLVLNAADSMPAGGAVTVEARRYEDTVRVEVTDQGPGVPEELKERIFEPFFTTKGKGGTGLGLSICRSIVARHSGRVWVNGRNGGGSRFVVAIPALFGRPV